MKFKVHKTKEAEKEFKKLADEQKNILNKDYKIVETKSISYEVAEKLGIFLATSLVQ